MLSRKAPYVFFSKNFYSSSKAAYLVKKTTTPNNLLYGFATLLTHVTRVGYQPGQVYGLRQTLLQSRRSITQKAPAQSNLNFKLMWAKWRSLYFLMIELRIYSVIIYPLTSVTLKKFATAFFWANVRDTQNLQSLLLEQPLQCLKLVYPRENVCVVVLGGSDTTSSVQLSEANLFPTIGLNRDYNQINHWFDFLVFKDNVLLEFYLLAWVCRLTNAI